MQPLQTRVAQFVAQHRLQTDVAHRLLDAMSELGELSKEVLKGSRYGAQPFAPTAHWEDELGDVLFSLICVANLTQTDLGAAFEGALRKYESRLAAAGSVGSR